jgi:hypothetical protein
MSFIDGLPISKKIAGATALSAIATPAIRFWHIG